MLHLLAPPTHTQNGDPTAYFAKLTGDANPGIRIERPSASQYDFFLPNGLQVTVDVGFARTWLVCLRARACVRVCVS